MPYQATFKRYELKFLLTETQKDALTKIMEQYMRPDRYGLTSIRNLYYDTDSYRLIRRSIEKPVYKEKLRLRSYGQATDDSTVFLELKKKYKDVVYKRRVAMTESGAFAWMQGIKPGDDSQIGREIDYFTAFYGSLHPTVFLSYDRVAWYCMDGSDFRVTFDTNILCRQEDLTLKAHPWGTPLLPENTVLMEIKTSGGIPMWMTHFLSANKIYKTSFSKYGTAYRNMIYSGGQLHV